jgi:L-fuculose-phosphate aldolase
LAVISSDGISQLIWLTLAHICRADKRLATIGEPPHLSVVEMARVHEQMKRMGYGQAPDLDDVGDVPRAVAKSKPGAH